MVTKSGTPVASLTIPDGSVMSTIPAAGTKVPLSTQIVLRVSGGGEAVPTVTDEQVSDAETAIRAAHLVPNVIREQGPPGATPGSVWQESPSAQKVVLPGSTVNLYVVPGSASPSSPVESLIEPVLVVHPARLQRPLVRRRPHRASRDSELAADWLPQ